MSLLSTGGGCPSGVYALADQYSYTPAGLVTKKRLSLTANVSTQSTTLRTANLDTSQTYDSQGRVLTVTYPDAKAYTYAYDSVSRPISLTDNQPTPVAWVNNVQYGLSGELLQMTYAGITETRTYNSHNSHNSRLQLTAVGSMEYRYSPNQNNGQITQQKDWSSGEEVTYAYDSLQRLISAVTTDSPTVPQWGQSFTYDGFGNRTSATVTKRSAPHGNWSYDPATNRGGGTFDANGNMTSGANLTGLVYDVENRLVSVPTYNQNGAGSEQYAYDPGNKRIYKRTMDGTEELYFYGISGQKLGTYRPYVYQYGVLHIDC
jgi:YD repeat-containing protein